MGIYTHRGEKDKDAGICIFQEVLQSWGVGGKYSLETVEKQMLDEEEECVQ